MDCRSDQHSPNLQGSSNKLQSVRSRDVRIRMGCAKYSDHYFSREPKSKHEEFKIQAFLRGKQYTFITDSSVFSKRRVDTGTRILIENMEIKSGDVVCDLGCGYGALGIVAADLASNGAAFLIDSNKRAISLAARNIRLNRVSNGIAQAGSMFNPVEGRVFNVILTNPPIRAGKTLVNKFIEESFHHMAKGGVFYLVARTRQGAKTFKNETQRVFSNANYVAIQSGYRVDASTLA